MSAALVNAIAASTTTNTIGSKTPSATAVTKRREREHLDDRREDLGQEVEGRADHPDACRTAG